ncbi:hypothetical protein BU23DRAFT_263874 [Bimuria novae-zelandiae CBS 107.79]|uniref:Uncharacterized protein n=1 Tax=Bimuria novae-zelandiae CBS 107.79 TaxID=1447943 RepID=A0A6A5UTL7_9PLEO|nr:hypothetical protein BU23DRAFT_263874 [Bimuria novae-zelandiae CBS 107.79]
MTLSQHTVRRFVSTARSQCINSAAAFSATPRFASTAANAETSKAQKDSSPEKPAEQQQKHKKTQAEFDQELQAKLQDLAGDGGASGVEYEDGQPVSMKRSVKNNMFRYI